MKPTKNNPNSNSNNFFNENSKKNNRPNTVFRREEAPVKIIDKHSRNAGRSPENANNQSNQNNTISNNLVIENDQNLENNPALQNEENENNNLYSSENFESNFENINQNNLPPLSNSVKDFKKERAKTATGRLKIKLENIANMFNNPPMYYTKKNLHFKTKSIGLVPGIPDDFLTRLKLVFNIFKDKNLINYVEKAPSKNHNKLDVISEYLWNYHQDKNKVLDFYAVFFYYLCTKIKYDVEGKNKDEKNLENIFHSGFANSLQFCKLFEYLCKKHLLRIKRIEGFCKSKELPYFKKGTDVTKVNHHWNAIYINHNWYFCDLTFGSGGIKNKDEFAKNFFNPYYFLTPPDYLIESHRPIDDLWQLTTKIIPTNQFSNKKDNFGGEFYQQVYEHNINLVTHKFPVIHCDGPINIQIGVKEMAIQAFLFYSNFKTKAGDVKFSYNDKDKLFILEPSFPCNGEYWLEILYREFTSNEVEYFPLVNYKIIVDDSQEKYMENLKKQNLKKKQKENLIKELKKKRPRSVRLPLMTGTIIAKEEIIRKREKKNYCLDNEGAHLISPNIKNIKIDQINEFKVLVPNSENVCVLDGQEWNYLKRAKKDKNMWIGGVLIKNEDVLILSMKENGVFTEVFQLKAHRVTSNLLRMNKIRKEMRSWKSLKKIK